MTMNNNDDVWFLIRAVEMISLSHFLSLLFSVLNLAKTKPKAALADGFDQFLFRLFLTDVFKSRTRKVRKHVWAMGKCLADFWSSKRSLKRKPRNPV